MTEMLSLSPSRVADFKTCPLLYRFRAIDAIPEPPSPAAVRGNLVHRVLERLFDRPAGQRTVSHAHDLAASEWQRMLAEEPDVGTVVGDDAGDLEAWLSGAADLLDTYFRLENPNLVEPTERELELEVGLDDSVRVKGIIDRVDVAPTGEVRVVDYKTGRAPSALFEQRALFQLRVYALLIWRARGRVPSVLQLVYLADGQLVRLEPDEDDLRALERTLRALALAISRARRSGDFRPSRSRLCEWCSHQALCPEWGGSPPPYPGPERLGAATSSASGAAAGALPGDVVPSA